MVQSTISKHINQIVLIAVDTLRRKNLGCYGYPCETSPNIDKFAEGAITYDQNFSVSNKTDPCFTSLMTGLFPHNHGVIHHANEIKPEELERVYDLPTIATEMFKRGWNTIGLDFLDRWHRRGFEYYMGIKDSPRGKRVLMVNKLRELFNIQRGTWVQGLLEKTPLYKLALNLIFKHQDPPYTRADKLVDLAIPYLKPKTFLFLHFWDPHIPYWAPTEFRRGGKDDYAKIYPNTTVSLKHIRTLIKDPLRRYFFDCMMHDKEYAWECIRDYDAEIRFLDFHLGRLFEAIDWSDTMVILTADHGENLTETLEGAFTHDTFDDNVMHTPLIVSYPGCEPRRVVRDTCITDIAPTIIEGFKCDGRSLL